MTQSTSSEGEIIMRRLVLASLILLVAVGCAPATAPSTPAEPRAVSITMADGSVTPSGERVDLALGQTLVLTITSDHDDQVHVHGFDTTIDVPAGTTVVTDIVADRVGRYEVESHEPAMIILVLQIR